MESEINPAPRTKARGFTGGGINQIHKLLIKNKKTVAVAESCTGGLVSEYLSRLAGSSKYFILGIVAYSNTTKKDILKIPQSFLSQKGAVSEEIAKKMAQTARIASNADFGIGITGIAGPSGGTSENPVGTVFIAISGKNKLFCKRFRFKGSRFAVRKAAALRSLELLKKYL